MKKLGIIVILLGLTSATYATESRRPGNMNARQVRAQMASPHMSTPLRCF